MTAATEAKRAHLRSERLTTASRLIALRPQWEALLERMASDNPYLHPAWILPWWDTFGADHTMSAIAVWDDDTLVGLAPLMITPGRHARLPATQLQFIGIPQTDRADVLATPDRLEDVIESVLEALQQPAPRWDVLTLREVPDFSPTLPVLRRLVTARGWALHERVCAHVPVLQVDRPYEELRKTFKSNIKKQTQSKRNRLKRRGEVTVVHRCSTPEEVEADLGTIVDLEARSWKGRENVGITRTEAQRTFLKATLRQFARTGAADLAFLQVDGTPIAYHLGFRQRGRYYNYNAAFDPEWSDCSPGTVLMDEIIRGAADGDELTVLDASRSVLEHLHILARWSEARHTHLELTLYAPTRYGRLLHLIHATLAPRVRAATGALKRRQATQA